MEISGTCVSSLTQSECIEQYSQNLTNTHQWLNDCYVKGGQLLTQPIIRACKDICNESTGDGLECVDHCPEGFEEVICPTSPSPTPVSPTPVSPTPVPAPVESTSLADLFTTPRDCWSNREVQLTIAITVFVCLVAGLLCVGVCAYVKKLRRRRRQTNQPTQPGATRSVNSNETYCPPPAVTDSLTPNSSGFVSEVNSRAQTLTRGSRVYYNADSASVHTGCFDPTPDVNEEEQTKLFTKTLIV